MKKAFTVILLLLLFLQLYAQSKPTQAQRYKYSTNPLECMGFNCNSTISQVRKQLQDWDIVCKDLGFDGSVFYAENITWQDIFFDNITFAFEPSTGKIEYIMFSPSSKESKTKVINTFGEIVSNLPYRRKIQEVNNYNMQETHEYYNGKDESEFAELTIIGNSIFFTFHFNGSLQRNSNIYP